ncbi:Gldg family protein [Pleionea sediminis]|uniref:Gldg family protein n=1 Tax=Pleionea sediminis TaxID=2569479 RepID=UPI0011870F3B|nr:Gldg family protein [Pleionea sediminis]
MQPKNDRKSTIGRIASKEITLFFASPTAYLFLATFSAITLFVFFWGEAFFSRNIADVRPLFEWMPVLLIFLSATLTMRLWSEERRSGTLEHVLTQAIPLWYFVVGKFLGCMFLLTLALAVTLPLPLTVAWLGDLDWGPVWAGYLATLLLGAAYISIGLFVSARSNNQIVSLLSASVLCGILYLLGTPALTNLFSNSVGDWLRMIGSGSRFDAITRGVIDVSDLYYYASLIIVFLSLNTYSLQKERWISRGKRQSHWYWQSATFLFILNALAANFWMGQINSWRIDVTRGNQYSISEATQSYIDRLQEPLLIRGYFSNKTHPLLSPLVPQLKDLIREYEVAGDGKIRVELVDPQKEPEIEKEANEKYNIRPVPFQVADRYQSSIVSSYFNVLVQYGDQYKVLGFRDLIEVKATGESDIDVQLRNPEHDMTRAIKSVLNEFQSSGNLFATVNGDMRFTLYVSDDNSLPEQLKDFKQSVAEVLDDTVRLAKGQFSYETIDPEANNGEVALDIAENYGFQPMSANLFSDDRFYFYMTLEKGEQIVQIPLADMTKSSFEKNLEAGIKRFASGFTKTVALVAPEQGPAYSPYGASNTTFNQLEQALNEELNVMREDISDGSVSGEADILLVVAPETLDEKSVFAIDQFLMKGGTVIAATSPFKSSLSQRSLTLQKHTSGLSQWLQHHGLTVEESVILDPNNASFPIPISRNVGGYQVQEMRMFDYPFFPDIRGQGLNQDNLITSELPQVTMPWSSPIKVSVDESKVITPLLETSDQSWVSSNLDVSPKLDAVENSGFTTQGEQARRLVGVINQGVFDSYFSDKKSPLIEGIKDKESDSLDSVSIEDNDSMTAGNSAAEPDPESTLTVSSVIKRSPESARIILFSSNDFLSDRVLQLLGSAQQSEYLNTVQMLANTVDWSLEDAGLLSIRSRSHFNKTLPPMEQSAQMFWEYLNYGLALISLGLIGLIVSRRRYTKQKHYVEQFVS